MYAFLSFLRRITLRSSALPHSLVCHKTVNRLYSKYSTQIKPISYLKANAAEIMRQLNEQREPMIITQNGEAKMVIQDVASYEETQETMALLKILAIGNREIEAGEVIPAADVIRRLRKKNAQREAKG